VWLVNVHQLSSGRDFLGSIIPARLYAHLLSTPRDPFIRIARSSVSAYAALQRSLGCEESRDRRPAGGSRPFLGHRRGKSGACATYSSVANQEDCLPVAMDRSGWPGENRAAKHAPPKTHMPGMPAGHSGSATMNCTLARHVGLLSAGSNCGLRREAPARTGTG